MYYSKLMCCFVLKSDSEVYYYIYDHLWDTCPLDWILGNMSGVSTTLIYYNPKHIHMCVMYTILYASMLTQLQVELCLKA